ncbi:hypothetical protein N2152v2_008551 [Parachlorella kessleri]
MHRSFLLLLVLACTLAGATAQGVQPDECKNSLVYYGNQWDKQHIECHYCGGQLKCDYDNSIITSPKIKCNLDTSYFSGGKNWECPIKTGQTLATSCDWTAIRNNIPADCYEPSRRILTVWRPGS